MGMAVGAHPQIKVDDPLLHERSANGEGYDVMMTTEEARFNINSFLTEDRKVVLQRLFESWGLAPPDAETVVDCLMDWVDSDDLKRPRGAEKDEYEQAGFSDRPFNRPFISLDEMEYVQGMSMVAKVRPNWRDSFTVWGSGLLDVNEASPELIAIAANAPLVRAEALVTQRNGPDGVPHTKDDLPLLNLQDVMALLGSNDPLALSLFTLQGTTVRLQSVGHVGDYYRGVAAVMQKGPSGVKVMEWREFVPARP